MWNSLLCFLLFSLFLFGCSSKAPDIIKYELKHTGYLETIDGTGTIEAVNKMMLLAPRINFSGVTVAHLAAEGTHVLKGDTVCILDAPELIYYIDLFRGDLEKMEADMKKLEADNALELAMLNSQIETNKAQIAISMLDSVQMKFATPVKKRLLELEMEKVSIEKKKLQKKLAAQKLIDNSELNQLRSRIMMQKNRIQMYETQMNSLKLVAPCDGVVMHYESPVLFFMGNGVGTRGGKIEEKSSVFSNMPLLQFPDMKEMQVSVEVPETDYKRIKENQKVQITVESSVNLYTTGKVKRKALAGKGAGDGSTVKSYDVIISVDSCHNRMKPGLSAFCHIIVDEVKDTIVVPASAIFVRDSSKVVYVSKDDFFVPVKVETGLSNMSMSIISTGLTGNETIALTEPPYNLIHTGAENDSSRQRSVNHIVHDTVSKETVNIKNENTQSEKSILK